MAIRTVSAAGGVFTATGTWVGGVVPILGDEIVANATSGNLTLTATTVSLESADFTGYTRTLALGTNNFAISTIGTNFLIISAAMTITNSNGTFQFGVSGTTTVTSNGKALPIRISNSNQILNLTDELTISYVGGTLQGTITGANVVLTYTTPSTLGALIINSPYKFFIRPSGSLTFAIGGLPRGYTVFDTTNSISIGSPISIQHTTTAAASNNTLEFAQKATYTGAGSVNGLPNLLLQLTNAGWNGATFSILSTVESPINEFQIQMLPAIAANLNLVNKLIVNNFTVLTPASQGSGKGKINVKGSGFSASNVYVYSSRQGGNNLDVTSADLTLSSGATYSITNLVVSGMTPSLNALFSSFTASVPATVNIQNAGFIYAEIIDINNVGQMQYAFTQSGNTLTRTTGITNSISSGGGGGGGSFTFVN